jgi:HlyD family secretion protein
MKKTVASKLRRFPLWLGVLLAVAVLAAVLVGLRAFRAPEAPEGFATGNGRIEATAYDVATNRAGRIEAVHVREGDLVAQDQLVAQIDTTELEAQRAEAEAALEMAREGEHVATSHVAERESERKLSQLQLARTKNLAERSVVSQQRLDEIGAQAETAGASRRGAEEQVHAAKAAIHQAEAHLARIQVEIDESTIESPIAGRVLYRLAEPGEVLAVGGKVVTVLDLNDLYMTIFLPTEEAGRVGIGAEARIVLDAVPDLVLPAVVSFVAPEAQFTPKEVETRKEREKLMFRVKVKPDPSLLPDHLAHAKSGLPGEAIVRIDEAAPWPERFAVRLPE